MAEKPPESYLGSRRPPLREALALEDGTVKQAMESLTRKGYFTPPPRPWVLGYNDRGLGHGDWAILDSFGDLVVKVPNRETADFIISAVNNLE